METLSTAARLIVILCLIVFRATTMSDWIGYQLRLAERYGITTVQALRIDSAIAGSLDGT